MGTVVVLLRGINVGGHNRVPMADLRRIAADLGLGDPRTHLQSGNLVVSTDRAQAGVATALHDAIEESLGPDVAVITRTGDELLGVMEDCPFTEEAAAEGKRVHVAFLDGPVGDVADFDAAEFAPEQLWCAEREVHLHLPGGIGRSKLATALGRIPTFARATVRNWNTVEALGAMVRG